jgi:hypothetical protein
LFVPDQTLIRDEVVNILIAARDSVGISLSISLAVDKAEAI